MLLASSIADYQDFPVCSCCTALKLGVSVGYFCYQITMNETIFSSGGSHIGTVLELAIGDFSVKHALISRIWNFLRQLFVFAMYNVPFH